MRARVLRAQKPADSLLHGKKYADGKLRDTPTTTRPSFSRARFTVDQGELYQWRLRFLPGGFGLSDYANDDVCKFKGACFEATLSFGPEYPFEPPALKFMEHIPYHPNLHHHDARHGDICISILHRSGVDGFNTHESSSERWKSVYSIRAICVLVMDLLGHPNMNGGTPASAAVNGVLLRTPKEFAQKTAECARLSREKAPQDVFERAARDKEQYDAIHEACYKSLIAAHKAYYESIQEVVILMFDPTSGRSESSDDTPSWVFTDDDTTS
jgi:ubiquitin-protein ligase